MTDAESPALDFLRNWSGPTETTKDIITERLVKQFKATFGGYVAQTEAEIAPPGIHWCLAPATPEPDDMLVDGLMKRGSFLPPVPLPRSMWAAGKTVFHQPLRLGDSVTKVSRVTDVTPKFGASGRLVFVTVHHQFKVERVAALEEWQTIVYRDAVDRSAAPATAPANVGPSSGVQAVHTEKVAVDPVLLFRYAALTFNSHRIHYDVEYARETEGYPGLVVQGALQATLLLNLALRLNPGAALREFSCRAAAASFSGSEFHLCAAEYLHPQKFWIENSSNR